MELLILVASVIAHLVIGTYIFLHNPKSFTNKFFALFTYVSATWGIVNYFSINQETALGTLTTARWVLSLGVLHSFSLYLLIKNFPNSELNFRVRYIVALICLAAIVFVLTQTPLVFSSIKESNNGFQPVPGPAIPAFAGLVGYFILSAFITLFKKYKQAKGVLKSQLQYLIIGVIGSVLLIFITNFLFVIVLEITALLPLGPTYTLIFIGSAAYAIVAHQLFDIRVIIRRTVVYSGLLAFTLLTYSMIVFFFAEIFGRQQSLDPRTFIANLAAATLIAFGFEPLRRWLTAITDKYLFKAEYDPQTVLAKLSEELSNSVDLREATQSLVTLVKDEMRLSHAAVITFGEEKNAVIVKEVTQSGYKDPSVLRLRPENQLLQGFARKPDVLVTDQIRRDCEGNGVHKSHEIECRTLMVDLEKLQVALVLPILVHNKAIGMFLVGEKMSGDAFGKNEVEFLEIVATQTASAIQKARLWEEDQLKSEFVSIASHELLTPTAAMKGYLSMILDDHMGQVDEKAQNYLVKVRNSADRLAVLVEDLLNVSRIESGRIKINKKIYSLVESVQKAVDELKVNADKKQLDFAFVVPHEAMPEVYADDGHIYRVMVNLIGNAIKYTPSGWVRCFVSRYSPTHLLFTVSDSGLGIPKENIPHLFEKFYRADRKEIAGIQGTGLGLYISKKIVNLMGGELWVESDQGKGSTFYFTLPVATDAHRAEMAQIAQQQPESVLTPVATASDIPAQQPVAVPSQSTPSLPTNIAAQVPITGAQPVETPQPAQSPSS